MEQEQTVFELIGQYIVDSVDVAKWQQAMLDIEIAQQSVGLQGKYVTEAGFEKPFDAPGDYSLAKAILELHRLSNETPSNRWNRATATLSANHDLKLEYAWDQALHDEVQQLSAA